MTFRPRPRPLRPAAPRAGAIHKRLTDNKRFPGRYGSAPIHDSRRPVGMAPPTSRDTKETDRNELS